MDPTPSLQAHQPAPYHLPAGAGMTYNFGVDFTIKAGEASSAAGAAVAEYTTRAGQEPPDHVHPAEDEMFYVLEGEVTFRCADRSFEVRDGGFVFLPMGVRHGYTIPPDRDVKLLVITSPPRERSGGWGGFLGDVERDGRPSLAPGDDRAR